MYNYNNLLLIFRMIDLTLCLVILGIYLGLGEHEVNFQICKYTQPSLSGRYAKRSVRFLNQVSNSFMR